MTTRNDGGPAFPRSALSGGDHGYPVQSDGMSLRDWFAATLPGELGRIDPEAISELAGPAPYIDDFVTEGEWGIARIRWFAEFEAAWRYMRADAMLAAREKEGR